MPLLLSVLKALSSIQDLGFNVGAVRGNLGGAITLLEKGFFSGEMGLRGDGTPTARRGSLACSPLQGLGAVLQVVFWWLFQAEEGLLVMMGWWL